MKAKPYSGILLFVLFALTFISSCKKEKTGCTDKDAIDYDSGADQPCSDCLSVTTANCCCEYRSEVLMWYDSTTSAQMADSGVSTLFYYLLGVKTDSVATSVYLSSAPDCGKGLLSGSFTWAAFNGGNAFWSVKDQNDKEIWQGSVTGAPKGGCVKVKLAY